MKNKSKKNYLDFIPEKNLLHKTEVSEEGVITIYRANTGWMEKITQKVLKKPAVTKIELEEYGNFIWPLIDGERSVFEIGKLVKEHFGDKAEPLYERLVPYFASMEQNKLITMKTKR